MKFLIVSGKSIEQSTVIGSCFKYHSTGKGSGINLFHFIIYIPIIFIPIYKFIYLSIAHAALLKYYGILNDMMHLFTPLCSDRKTFEIKLRASTNSSKIPFTPKEADLGKNFWKLLIGSHPIIEGRSFICGRRG